MNNFHEARINQHQILWNFSQEQNHKIPLNYTSLASKEKGMDQVTLEKASLQFPLELPSLKSKEMVKKWNLLKEGKKKEGHG